MEAPKKPVRPSSREVLDHFVSSVLAFKQFSKADPEFYDEMFQYFSSETERLGKVLTKAKKYKSLELVQEALNLNRRLSIMSLFLKFLR